MPKDPPNQKTSTKLLPLKLETYAKQRLLPVSYLQDVWDLKDAEHLGVACIEQPYLADGVTDQLGALSYRINASRYRFANQKLSPSGAKLTLYGQAQLQPGPSKYLFLVEGESDTQTLRYLNYPVLGIPGTSTWDTCLKNDPSAGELLKTYDVLLIVQEPPSSKEQVKNLDSSARMVGKIQAQFPNSIAMRLWEFAPKDKHGQPLYKDVSGMWMHYRGNRRFFCESLQVAIDAAAEKSDLDVNLQTITLDQVADKLMEWLWEDRIPLNEITLFYGMPDTGKSSVMRNIVASVTTGKAFYDRQNTEGACDVLLFVKEDDIARKVKPALRAHGAALTRIHIEQGIKLSKDAKAKERQLALDKDLELLERKLNQLPNVRLVVIDPISSYLGDIDRNKDRDVRPLLDKLKTIAERTRTAILVLSHFNKNADQAGLHRISGAGAWSEVPRAAWAFVVAAPEEDDEKPPQRLMLNAKLNITADSKKRGLAFLINGADVQLQINGETKTANVGIAEWTGQAAAEATLDRILHGEKNTRGPEPVKTRKAMEWLKTYLADGPKAAKNVYSEGEAEGHKEETLKEARKRLGIESNRIPAGKGPWWWSLPTTIHTGVSGHSGPSRPSAQGLEGPEGTDGPERAER